MFIRGGGGMPVALIGLAGALIPAYVGYLAITRKEREKRRRAFVKAQRETYQEIFEKVTSIDVDLQKDIPQLSGLRDKRAEISAYVQTHSIYLAKGDHKLVDRYLRALGELAAWMQSAGSDEKVTTKLRRKARPVAAVSEKLNNRVRKILQQG